VFGEVADISAKTAEFAAAKSQKMPVILFCSNIAQYK
jgi:hypothetical protein